MSTPLGGNAVAAPLTEALAPGDARERRRALFAFAIVAGLVGAVWVYKVLIAPLPYWIFHYGDGEAIYFLYSLEVASGHRPPDALHPGTPVQLLGALMLWVTGTGPEAIQGFLTVGYSLSLVLIVGTIAWLAFSKLGGTSFLLRAAVLLSFFVNPALLTSLTAWSTYMFMLPVAALALWRLRRSLETVAELKTSRILLAGACAGFAGTIHLSLLSIAAAGFLGHSLAVILQEDVRGESLPKRLSLAGTSGTAWRLALAGGLLLIVFAFGATLAALLGNLHARLQVPVRSAAGLPLLFLANLIVAGALLACLLASAIVEGAWRSAAAGAKRGLAVIRANADYLGGVLLGWWAGTFLVLDRLPAAWGGFILGRTVYNLPATETVTGGIKSIFARAPAWATLVAVTVILLAAALVRAKGPRRTTLLRPLDLAYGTALLAMIVMGTVLAVKQGGVGAWSTPTGTALRYFLPVGIATTFGLAWLADLFAKGCWTLPGARHGAAAIAGLVFVGFSLTAVADLRAHTISLRNGEAENREIDALLKKVGNEMGRPPVALFWEVSRPSWALRWADGSVEHRFREKIDRLFPHEGQYDIRARRALLPGSATRFDLIVMRESQVTRDNVGNVRQFYEHLATLGSVARLSNGFPVPMVVVSAWRR